MFTPQMHLIGEVLICSPYCAGWLFVSELRTRKHHYLPQKTALFGAMIHNNKEEYTCFVSHSFDVPVGIVWSFPESERGLRNLQRLVSRHAPVDEPAIRQGVGNRKRLHGDD